MLTINKEIEKDPTLEEMSNWSKERIGWRVFLLALICADRKTKQDDTWQWADRELRKITPLVDERFV